MSPWQRLLEGPELRVSDLERVYQDYGDDKNLWRAVAGLLEDGNAVAARHAGWLLLRKAKAGGVEPALVRHAVLHAGTQSSWQARLHLCQFFSCVTCPTDASDNLVDFLNGATRAAEPFVRAWALTAMVRVAQDHPRHAFECTARWQAACADPSKAVQARLRRLSHLSGSRKPSK